MESYRQAWRKRLIEEDRLTQQRATRARAMAQSLAEVLRSEFRVRRVVLIGSLARGEFGDQSDIDLVAEGLPPADLFRASARLQALAGDLEVDLAPLEDLRPRARRAVQEEGIEL